MLRGHHICVAGSYLSNLQILGQECGHVLLLHFQCFVFLYPLLVAIFIMSFVQTQVIFISITSLEEVVFKILKHLFFMVIDMDSFPVIPPNKLFMAMLVETVFDNKNTNCFHICSFPRANCSAKFRIFFQSIKIGFFPKKCP